MAQMAKTAEMMESKEDRLHQWLRDAHAMEEQALTMLNAQAQRLEHYPELRNRIEKHIQETESQERRLRELLEQNGGGTSAMKDAMGKMTAMMQGMSGLFAGDEVVKGAMAGYVFEHLEIASYRALAAAAAAAGDTRTEQLCESILEEEENMARWLDEHMPQIVETFLEREARDMTAKR